MNNTNYSTKNSSNNIYHTQELVFYPFCKEPTTDNEGTPINISTDLSLSQCKQLVILLKQFVYLFTTDNFNSKTANIKPNKIKIKSNHEDPEFHTEFLTTDASLMGLDV